VILNHALHHGANWAAGEVGYMLLPNLPADAPRQEELGALESAVGGKRIERAWAEANPSSGREKPLQATDIFDLAIQGNEAARNLLHRAAGQLAMAVTNISLILDLSLVVLSGGVSGHRALLEAMRRRLQQNEFARPQLVTSTLAGEVQIHGAIWLAMQTVVAQRFRRRGVQGGSAVEEAL
jgi:glucokinase